MSMPFSSLSTLRTAAKSTWQFSPITLSQCIIARNQDRQLIPAFEIIMNVLTHFWQGLNLLNFPWRFHVQSWLSDRLPYQRPTASTTSSSTFRPPQSKNMYIVSIIVNVHNLAWGSCRPFYCYSICLPTILDPHCTTKGRNLRCSLSWRGRRPMEHHFPSQPTTLRQRITMPYHFYPTTIRMPAHWENFSTTNTMLQRCLNHETRTSLLTWMAGVPTKRHWARSH